MTEREAELGDPLEGEVPEEEPDLPAIDEETLDDDQTEPLTIQSPDPPEPPGYDPTTQPEPL